MHILYRPINTFAFHINHVLLLFLLVLEQSRGSNNVVSWKTGSYRNRNGKFKQKTAASKCAEKSIPKKIQPQTPRKVNTFRRRLAEYVLVKLDISWRKFVHPSPSSPSNDSRNPKNKIWFSSSKIPMQARPEQKDAVPQVNWVRFIFCVFCLVIPMPTGLDLEKKHRRGKVHSISCSFIIYHFISITQSNGKNHRGEIECYDMNGYI